jgi:hypothetical protein
VKRYLRMARLGAALLVIALTGPSLVPLACELTCGSAHRYATGNSTDGCHQHDQQPDAAALSAGYICHDPLAGTLLVRPAASALTPVAAPPRVPELAIDESLYQPALTATPHLGPPGSARILPPLRI